MLVHRLVAATVSLGIGVGALVTAHAGAADPIKLSGCLVKAERGDGYLVINAPREPAATTPQGPTAAPGVVGTTGMFANVFYWLDKDDELAPHVGHQVEIEGELKGQLREGEIKIDRKDAWTEIDVRSDGREMRARVPNASVVAAPNADRKMDVLVRRVEVDKVRMTDAICR
jgi:hypothetical protein